MKYIVLPLLVCIMLSCSKTNADGNNDKIKPVLTIIAPVTSEVYRTGDPLCFKGDVIDDFALNNVQLKLFRADNLNRPVVQYSYSVSGRSFHVEEKTYIPATLSGNCILQFEATDFYNNRAVATMNFSSN